MLTTLKIKLKGENVKFSPHFGSLLHGVIMQRLDPDYAAQLHENSLKPYSSFLYYDKEHECHMWKISTLTQETRDNLLPVLLDESFQRVFVEQKKQSIDLIDRWVSNAATYRDFAEQHLMDSSPSRKVTINFHTPTTFKINGEYAIFPYIENIYQSLLNRWESFHSVISLDDKDVLRHLIDHTRLIGYNLRSTRFGMEKVRIQSFQGEICLHVSGPITLVRIAKLLFSFGEFAGIGAKTALGMGGVSVM